VISTLLAADAVVVLLALGGFVGITAFMVFVYVMWAKHGFFPTRGLSGRLAGGFISLIPSVRRRRERWNREAGWGDMGDDDSSPRG
jgi:hypothetical protein